MWRSSSAAWSAPLTSVAGTALPWMATTGAPCDDANGVNVRPNDSDGSHHGLMHAGDTDRPGLRVQAVVERRADGQHPATGTFARFEDDHPAPGPPQEVSRAQAGEARADDDDKVSRVRGLLLGGSLQKRRRGRSRQGRELEKPSTSNVSPHCDPAAEPPF